MHPVLLRLGAFELPTYGVLVAAAWLAAIQVALAKRSVAGLSEDEAWSVIYWVFGGAFAGGKLLYLVLNRADVDWSRPLDALRFGFVFYGGLLGAVAAGAALCRLRGWSLLKVADPFAAALPLGQAIGRLGCLAAGCCYGRHTDMPWGLPMAGDPSRHPTQLYESVLDLALFAWVSLVLRGVERGRRAPGAALLAYALGYGALRFAVELFRGDERGGAWLGLSPSQWIALATAAAAGAALAARRRSA